MQNKMSAFVLMNKDEYNPDFDRQLSETLYNGLNIDFKFLFTTEHILEEFNKDWNFDCFVTIGDNLNFDSLSNMSFEFRKKWVHFDTFDSQQIVNATVATAMYNIRRDKGQDKLFSIFTCTYHTPHRFIDRLYKSLLEQTYPNWNWWILDDSKDDDTVNYLKSLHDPRIIVVKNITHKGSIGFNKHSIAMMADGDYLLEVDHDDILIKDCLELLNDAFNYYLDAGFAYGDSLELSDEKWPINYGDYFAFGQGTNVVREVEGMECDFSLCCPSINAKSIRGIYAQPNHPRCWRRETYHQIGGHVQSLSVCDDMELNIHTFLNTKMIHVGKVLYIQFERGERGEGTGNTQSSRFQEIQRTNWALYYLYDEKIHKRIEEMGFIDDVWDETKQQSDLSKDCPLTDYGYQY